MQKGRKMDAFVPTLTPQQMEFLASDTLCEILPTQPMDELSLMSGTVGPLYPQVPATVPLWLAVHLKKRNRCRIRPPAWITRVNLERLLKVERDLGAEGFAPLPSPYFVELATLMLVHAKESVGESERVHQIVEQILDIRR